jgi:TonB family protein
MIAAWIGYCLLVSALLGLAALLAERALGHYQRPVRWAWAGAIIGSLTLPALAYLVPSALRGVGAPIAVELLPLDGVSGASVDAVAAGPAAGLDLLAWLTSANALFLAIWLGSILILGGYLATTFGRLRGEMRSWIPGRILDAPVLVSLDRGPAVIGLRRSVIVLPQWIAEVRDDVLRLIFRHEREHQLAGDQRLFALGVVGTVAMPWNPIMWWQLRRLRLAIEFDCDHRVIAAGVPAREYAEALLEVGSRVSHPPLAAAAFAERRSAVERRLHRMTQPLSRLRGPRALATAGVAALLVGLACQSPVPPIRTADTDQSPQADAVSTTDLMRPQLDDPSERPRFVPFDTPPRLENFQDVQQALRAEYPASLRAAGVGGRVELWLYVIAEGTVANSQIKTSSGERALDDAAIEVAEHMRFAPAVYEESPTAVWVSHWIAFKADDQDAGEEATAGRAGGRLGPNPLFVIDGVVQPSATTMEQIDRQNIETIEIIKGDAARALYGDRAGDGAISITTKSAADRATDAEPPPPPPPLTAIREPGSEATDEPPAQEPGRLRVRVGGEPPALIAEPGEPPGSLDLPEPLVVIDGVIQDDFTVVRDMNPDDIDSIEVLKGSAALEVYGVRGSNGVIRITTEKP